MDRRSFLKSAAATGALAPLGGFAKDTTRLFEISLAQWSLNRRFFKREEPHLDNLDFAKTAASLNIHAVEYVNQFFKDKANDPAYLKEMKKRADGEGVKSLIIMVDGEGNLGDPDDKKRQQAVENHYKWVEAANFLGCHSIRVNARSSAKLSWDEQMKLAADGLRKLTEYGAKEDMNTIVENHGGLSSNGEWLVGVMKQVNHDRCGTLPDFGNFQLDRKKDEWYDRYKGVKEMMPFAKAVSAKAHDFREDEPWKTFQGEHATDFLKMMKIVLDAVYRGYVGIESEGKHNQLEGVKNTRDLLIRVRDELTPAYK